MKEVKLHSITRGSGKEETVYVDVTYGYTGNKPTHTHVAVYMDRNREKKVASGSAACHESDSPNKLYGRRQALKNMFKNVNWSKENRKRMYEAIIPKLAKPVKQEVEVEEEDDSYDGEDFSCVLAMIMGIAGFFYLINLMWQYAAK